MKDSGDGEGQEYFVSEQSFGGSLFIMRSWYRSIVCIACTPIRFLLEIWADWVERCCKKHTCFPLLGGTLRYLLIMWTFLASRLPSHQTQQRHWVTVANFIAQGVQLYSDRYVVEPKVQEKKTWKAKSKKWHGNLYYTIQSPIPFFTYCRLNSIGDCPGPTGTYCR